MMKKATSIMLSLCFFVLFSLSVNGANDIVYEKINPSDAYSYSIKRLREKLALTLLYRSPSKKMDFLKTLLSRRIAEIKYVVDNKDIANIQTSSQRYSTTAGQITETIIKFNLETDKSFFRNLFLEHIALLENWQTEYKFESAEWLFLKWDIDYLKLYLEKLSN